MESNLNSFAGFWMRQQKLWGWYGMWDYGDVAPPLQERLRLRSCPPDTLAEMGEQHPRRTSSDASAVRGNTVQDY